ncbi:hypothetical protein P7L78_09360 [Tistrella bauzanensis]|uniref:SGNH hydrolase-type esterase domain-containing protein n=1 Tax=Tistrella arctica TaxID=3133430 RepID=A0ABU9YN66_9PROT
MPSSADKQAAAESGPAEAAWQRFWRIVIATALAGAVAIAALNALVDPTGAVHARWPDAPILCAEGPRGDIWVAATLPVRLDPPAVLVAGTSRVAVGIDQALLDQLADGRTARIVGLAGARMAELARWLIPLVDRADAPQRLILGLDYAMFAGIDRRAGATPPAGPGAIWMRALLHPDATLASLNALVSPDDCALSRGNRSGGDRGRSIAAAAAARGWDAVRTDAAGAPAARLRQTDAAALPDAEDMAALDAVLTVARARGIAVAVLLPPVHPVQRAALTATGHGSAFRRWHDHLSGLARSGTVALTDLGAAVDDDRLIDDLSRPGFLDPIHFTPALLRRLINK